MKTIATAEQLQLELFLRQREMGLIVWKTKNGEEIPIKDLSDTHISNILRMMERNVESCEHIGDMDPMDYYD